MTILIQVILTNLLLSCDNVVIIANVTKDLKPKQASSLRFWGICLAPVLVLLFIWLTSFLLTMSWMHVHILGGVLLLYVNYRMLNPAENAGRNNGNSENIILPILSIIAADLTLSLENSISILSIVAKNGAVIGGKEIGQIISGLLIGIPILLLLGQTISKLLDKLPVITYLCSGYLTFMAVQMVCQDGTIQEFFYAINFTLTTFTAAIIGILVAVSNIFLNSQNLFGTLKRRKVMTILGLTTVAYALFTIIRITYLSTNPIIDGMKVYAEEILGFIPCGANAIYTLSTPPHLFPILMIFLSGLIFKNSVLEKPSFNLYIHQYNQSLFCMLIFVVSYILICTVGLSLSIGFGPFSPLNIINFLLQIFVIAIYLSIFFFIRSLSKVRAVGTFCCLMFILLENLLLEIFFHIKPLQLFMVLLPDYYAHTLETQLANSVIPVQLLLVGFVIIIVTLWTGGTLFSEMKYKK